MTSVTYPTWEEAMADAVTDPAELARLLQLPASIAAGGDRAPERFRLMVPRPYLARIRPADPADPLLLQVLPTGSLRIPWRKPKPCGSQDFWPSTPAGFSW
jgi:L-lysine 2,3-aminomutase